MTGRSILFAWKRRSANTFMKEVACSLFDMLETAGDCCRTLESPKVARVLFFTSAETSGAELQ